MSQPLPWGSAENAFRVGVSALEIDGKGVGRLVLDLAGRPLHLALTWLPGQEIVSCDWFGAALAIATRSGMRLQVEFSWTEGVLIGRGVLTGVCDPPLWPVPPAESALARDYGAGGVCLLRAEAPLPAADAYQRPRWRDDGWTVEILTLDARIGVVRGQGPSIDLMLYPPHRGRAVGMRVAFAVLTAPDDQFTTAWRALVCREGLPGAHQPADREKVLRIARRPTLFAFNPTNHLNGPRLIEWAARAGFGSILLHSPVWNATDATYQPNEQNWPGGWPALRQFVERAREHGLAVGLHTMTTSVADRDPYVTPVPDDRLLVIWKTRLAKAVDAGDTVLSLADCPEGMSKRDDYMSYGMTVRVGDELITYAGIDAAANSLTDCRRGAYGTQPAPHAAGETVSYLFRLFAEFTLDPESTLADEVAQHLARAFHETGAEMIYFDDSEAVPDPYRGHVSAYHEKVWRAIGITHLHVQASSTGPYGMYLLSRAGQHDTVIDKRALLDGMIVPMAGQYLAADLVPDFGWFGIVFGGPDRDATSDDDLDCLLARVTGFQGGVTIFGSPDLTGTSLFGKVARRMAAWHAAGVRGVDAKTRAALATPGREFRPVAEAGHTTVRESLPMRLRLVADADGAIPLHIEHPGARQSLRLSLTLRSPLAPRGDAGNRVLFQPGKDEVAAISGANPAVSSADGKAVLSWKVQDTAVDYTRWRVTFPAPADLTGHRALSLRYRIGGQCRAAVVRLVSGLKNWIMGMEFALPSVPGEHAVDDPPADYRLHQQGRWPDEWFSFTQGLPFHAVEAVEIVLIGLEGGGRLHLDAIEALRETRPPGFWSPVIQQGDTDYPMHPVSWDGTLTLTPEDHAVSAEIRENNGALYGRWLYGPDESPELYPGENHLRLYGLPPYARVDIRVDRMV